VLLKQPRQLADTPWVAPADPLEAEWAAVRRTVKPEEFAKLRELRSLVQAKGLDAHGACTGPGTAPLANKAGTLLRFLRARGGKPEAALAQLCEALDWRRDYQIDRKLKEWRSEWASNGSARVRILRKYGYIGLLGKCREGLPVYVQRECQADIGGIVREAGEEALLLYMLSIIEDQLEQADKRMLNTGSCINSFVEIHDIGNYGLVPSYLPRGFQSVPFYKANAPIFDKVYPERVRVCFLVRCPAAFNIIWKLVTPLIPEHTKHKIRLKGYDAKSWLQEMEALLPPDSIPAWLRCDDTYVIEQATPFGGIVPRGLFEEFKSEI